VAIKRRVVQLAQSEPIAHLRLALGVAVGHDVRGFEQLLMAEPTNRAVFLIRGQNALAERLLMEPLADLACDVPPANLRFRRFRHRRCRHKPPVIHGDFERKS
jgi:hypothetical protein